MKTIIAEKPSVAREIARIVGATKREEGYFEGGGYAVTWAFGHLVQLAMPDGYGIRGFVRDNLPVIPDTFTLVPRQVKTEKGYKPDSGVVTQIKTVTRLFKESEQIIVATDAGREGELIFRYLYHYTGCATPFVRLWISSLTDKAIREGLRNLEAGGKYDDLYLAAKARSESDWLVGINGTQALSIAAGHGTYSVGRVQTPTLAMVCASDAFFARLIEEAHKRGIRVLVDGVFNHCGSFNKWLDAELLYQHAGGYPQGAYVSEDSPYRYFFQFHNENAWPFNDSYDGWWGHATLPKLNYEEAPELYQYILGIAKKWVSAPFGADGWRLDVAADLGRSAGMNHQFWRDFRAAVKEANPEAVMIAEHYGSPYDWLKGDQWDTVMNYDAFMEPLSWFLTGMEKHSDEENPALFGDGCAFFEAMRYHMSEMPTASMQCAMNELSNHDHSRFMTRTNRRVGRLASAGAKAAEEGISYGIFRQGVVMQMTWPGAPTIYYGDEAGVCGWTDPDSRRTYPWGGENLELIEFHRYMSGIRKRCPAFRNGSLKELAAGDGYIAYGRFQSAQRAGGACCGVTAVNTGDDWLTLKIPVWQIGARDGAVLRREMMTYEDGYNAGQVEHEVKDGYIEVKIPPVGSIVLTGNDTAL